MGSRNAYVFGEFRARGGAAGRCMGLSRVRAARIIAFSAAAPSVWRRVRDVFRATPSRVNPRFLAPIFPHAAEDTDEEDLETIKTICGDVFEAPPASGHLYGELAKRIR